MIYTNAEIPPNHPLAPYIYFLEEANAFHRSVLYLTEAEISATTTSDSPLAIAHFELLSRISRRYPQPKAYFTARLFIGYLAAFEVFLQGTLAAVLTKYPKKIGHIEFRLADILDAEDSTSLVRKAIDQILNSIMYKKPMEYLKEVCSLLSIDQTPLVAEWKLFVEGKARRDLGVHNAWLCNGTYLRKVTEAGIPIDAVEGATLLPTDSIYLSSIHDALEHLSFEITMQVVNAHWPEHAKAFERSSTL